MNRLGVVVVTHNSEAVVGGCLDSLRAAGAEAEVVVVDNASGDRTCSEVRRRPWATLLVNSWNRGFAAAVNQAIELLGTPCVLLLNPDTEVVSGLEELARACRQPGVAAAGGKLLDAAGRPQTGFMVRRLPGPASLSFEALGINRLWPANPVNRKYRCLGLDADAAAEVEQPAGAFLALRREFWRELGGLDESFHPLWFDDVDYCKRARDRGHRILYVPSAVAKHKGGHSAGQLRWQTREAYWYGTLLTYASKHFRRRAVWAVCAAVVLGSVFRTIFGIFRRKSLKPILVYLRVIRLAGSCVWLGQDEAPDLSSLFAGR